jgi:hypothetical protein
MIDFRPKEANMDQLHKRFSVEQVKVLLQGYLQGTMARSEVEEMLQINKTRFFELLKEYRQAPGGFSLAYERATPAHLSAEVEGAIQAELLREKELVDDPQLPIWDYNYSALRDRLRKKGMIVSATTIAKRAKTLGCYLPHPPKRVHDRQVVTASIGAMVQHDASTHLWSPYASEKWTLITSIDDFSRLLLYAEFVRQETAWAHIQAAQSVMQTFGLPVQYYVDNLRVFRFVQNRDSLWYKQVLGTDEVDPQWRMCLRLLGVNVIYALSPQAKGKIERPYRWLQDRIVRTCALEHITTLADARPILHEEVHRYNSHQVHSTTGEVPSIRFTHAKQEGNSLFRRFCLPQPYSSAKDIFCLRDTRTVNGYCRISLFNHQIDLPQVPLHEDVELHLIPDPAKQLIEVRIWWNQKLLETLNLPLADSRVHL